MRFQFYFLTGVLLHQKPKVYKQTDQFKKASGVSKKKTYSSLNAFCMSEMRIVTKTNKRKRGRNILKEKIIGMICL